MTGASRAFNLIECAAKSARGEIERRHRLYRRGRARIDIAGKTVVLVDDGIATGITVRVALQLSVSVHRVTYDFSIGTEDHVIVSPSPQGLGLYAAASSVSSSAGILKIPAEAA